MPSGRSRPTSQVNAAVERAKAAQVEWAKTSIATRGKYMLAMLEALVGMTDEIVPEIAWQMGRPVRYGGEFGGVKERTQYMVEIAEKALAPVPASNPKDGFRRYVKKDPLGVVHGHRAVELSLSHRRQHHRAGADGRLDGDPQARRADAAGRRAFRPGLREGRPAQGRVPERRPEPRADRKAARLAERSTTSISPARSPAAAPSRRRRPAPS